MGGFGDTANNLENLARAGYGYVGSKLGMLSPSQLPELREPKDAILSSDWLVKNTPLEDTGSGEYTTGRLASLAIPILGGFASRPKEKLPTSFDQLGALFPGDKSGTIAVHAVEPERLMASSSNPSWMGINPNADIPTRFRNELYQPSFALTNGEILGTNFGNLLLIPNPRRVDPKTSPSVIRATDFYSPRYNGSYAGGGFDMGERLRNNRLYTDSLEDLGGAQNQLNYYKNNVELSDPNSPDNIQTFQEKIARALANKQKALQESRPNTNDVTRRYNDRFGSAFYKGGIYAEEAGQKQDSFTPANLHQFRIDASPRFQSLEHYVNSPYGGKLLTADTQKPFQDLAKVERALDETLFRLRKPGSEESLGQNMIGRDKLKFLTKAANGIFPSNLINDLTGKPITAEQMLGLQDFAQGLMMKIKTNPSDYGEIKRFGPMGINGDNFVGAILAKPQPFNVLNPNLISGFASRNIPYFDLAGRDKEEIANKIRDLQASVFSK
jgi:hypothetical protein